MAHYIVEGQRSIIVYALSLSLDLIVFKLCFSTEMLLFQVVWFVDTFSGDFEIRYEIKF